LYCFYVVSFVHCVVLLRRFFCPLYCSFTSFLLSIVLFFYVVSFVHSIVLLRRFFCSLFCSFTSFLLSIVLFFYVVSFVYCIVLLRCFFCPNTMDKRNDVKEQGNGQKKRRKRTIQGTKETT
jgi:hypothetical protein